MRRRVSPTGARLVWSGQGALNITRAKGQFLTSWLADLQYMQWHISAAADGLEWKTCKKAAVRAHLRQASIAAGWTESEIGSRMCAWRTMARARAQRSGLALVSCLSLIFPCTTVENSFMAQDTKSVLTTLVMLATAATVQMHAQRALSGDTNAL